MRICPIAALLYATTCHAAPEPLAIRVVFVTTFEVGIVTGEGPTRAAASIEALVRALATQWNVTRNTIPDGRQ